MGDGVIPVKHLERFCYDRVKMTSARLPELGVDHLLQQGMSKVVPDIIDASALLDDSLREQLLERSYQLHLGEAGYTCEGIVRGASADNRCEIRQSATVCGQTICARYQYFTNCGGDAKCFGFPAS